SDQITGTTLHSKTSNPPEVLLHALRTATSSIVMIAATLTLDAVVEVLLHQCSHIHGLRVTVVFDRNRMYVDGKMKSLISQLHDAAWIRQKMPNSKLAYVRVPGKDITLKYPLSKGRKSLRLKECYTLIDDRLALEGSWMYEASGPNSYKAHSQV